MTLTTMMILMAAFAAGLVLGGILLHRPVADRAAACLQREVPRV